MGLNIVIETLRGERAADWDTVRYAGDRDFSTLVSELPPSAKDVVSEPPDFETFIRPAQGAFEVWLTAIKAREWPNPGRFEHLMTVLEHNPDFYIYFSW